MNFRQNRKGWLARVTTENRAELTGFYAPSDQPDAITLIYVHGLSGSADTNFVFDLLALKKVAQLNVLLTNNSGRANITITRKGEPLIYSRSGSAFERFEDCKIDIKAWIDFSQRYCRGPVVLMGHSLGASKVVHYLADTEDVRVGGIVLASPADVTGGFIGRVGIKSFQRFLKLAKALVAEGHGDQLMPEDCVIGLLGHRLSAAAYLDRFEGAPAADMFNFFDRQGERPFRDLSKIQVPIMILYAQTGELVGGTSLDGAIAMLKEHAAAAPSIHACVVQGDHWYSGHEKDAMGKVVDWILQTIKN